jgi:hypothetical protein
MYLNDIIQKQSDSMGPQIRNVPAQFGRGVKDDDYNDPCLYRFVQPIALETSKHYRPYTVEIVMLEKLDCI